MDFEGLAKALAAQFVTVWNAPVPFLAVCIALWFAMRWFVRGQFETRLANAQSTIEMLEKKLDRRESAEVIAIAATQAAHEASSSETERQLTSEAPPDLSDIPEVTISPSDLMSLVKDRTKLQAKPFLDDHVGRVMTVKGEVRDAGELSSDTIMVSLMADKILVFAYFSPNPKVQALRKGETVKVRGILDGVSGYGFDLSDCEFA